MKKFLVFVLGIMLVVGGFILVNWPVPNWRLYDKNWRPLAMTQAENYCAGRLFGESGYQNEPDPAGMKACIADSHFDNETPNLSMSVRWACEGLNTIATDFPIEECMDQVESYEIWFLLDGGYTFEWNDGNPRPVVAETNFKNAPRGQRSEDDLSGRFG